MECRRVQHEQWLELRIEGRLDAQWADQLDRELSSLLRDGVRQIRLQMAGINFLSSAGIRILLKYRKELVAAEGCLQVTSPSEQVSGILQMTGLLALLEPSQPAASRTRSAAAVSSDNRLTFEGGSMTLYHPAPSATISLRTVGRPLMNGESSYTAACQLALPADTMALGLGAFGDSFIDCQPRFGEFMSVGGNAITLPADGGDTPDFLAGIAEFVPSVQALYAIICQGDFARFGQFSANRADESIPFSSLVTAAFELCKSDCIALTLIAETDGLVGASLLSSPALTDASGLLEFPAVRDRIGLTSEPAWPHSLALVCGIALRLRSGQALDDSKARSLSGVEGIAPFVRPLGMDQVSGHFHAAALSYRALPDGLLELAPTVTGLIKTQNLQGLFHLLHDTRSITGIGESSFLRGALWFGPATMQEETP
jgi:anti-anti-sigma factor